MFDQLPLPEKSTLDIRSFSRSFQKVVNSYKFYWFLAILDHVQLSNESRISLAELSLNMLSAVWYPLEFYKLSFGQQDSFKKLAAKISNQTVIENHIGSKELAEQLKEKLSSAKLHAIREEIESTLMRWVVYRFLRPFFEQETRGMRDSAVNKRIEYLSSSDNSLKVIPYAVHEGYIVLNKDWVDYFRQNLPILTAFTKWHLIKFLHRRNPDVIGLSEKLVKPKTRKMVAARLFWEKFMSKNIVRCIYSGEVILIDNISLDHFIPWSYVAHDEIWNIVPTSPTVNSVKSNALPHLETYYARFSLLQYKAFIYHVNQQSDRLLLSYGRLLGGSSKSFLTYDLFDQKLRSTIFMHHGSASQLGFSTDFIFDIPR